MEDSGGIIGCAGLISNGFISRMDLWPWICALYIENSYRGRSLGKELLLRAKADAEKAGFNKIFLCTDHIGYYEKYGFTYIGDRYHPWGSSSRIYESNNQNDHFSLSDFYSRMAFLNELSGALLSEVGAATFFLTELIQGKLKTIVEISFYYLIGGYLYDKKDLCCETL
ncbi:N-acetylglutamate synthase-like GNAT family acetyltransferase [Peribacillus simplex]|uniref:GNAT family N-acetyltransferase n=1 Tax=Peribacillus simplex TaxID=1478 RepID=UPI0024E1BE1B|nr:GNAT family N-acetyltransferase [Peribacillus simplex]MDF9759542.1 N-acetylglutamate synthase-like GNAT family acetyltransferase [Peribacillus simplex]